MEWFSKNKSWLAAAAFFVLSVAQRFLAASQTDHPTGWDGYYYVMQVHSWFTFGHLQSPDFSLIYPFFAAISFVAKDFILAYQVGVALLSGLLILTIFYSLKKRNVELVWICVICSYLLFSPLLTYFVLQFPKNVLGLIFLILFISSPRQFIFLIATIMSHRMTGGLALIIFLISVPWKWMIAGGAVILLISLLPGILHISDLARFKDQFVLTPHWAPYSFYEMFPSLSVLFKLDLVTISLVILGSFFLKPDRNWLIIAVISIFPFFAFEPGSAGHRFFLLAPVAFLMAMPFERLTIRFPYIPVFVLLVTSFFAINSYKPQIFDPPNDLYTRIVAKMSSLYSPKEYQLVIAHKSLAEIIIFTTDFDALNWLPPKDMAATHVLRLINGVYYPYFHKYLEQPDLKQVRVISSDYFAAPEDVWQRFVTNARQSNDQQVMKDIFNGRNPMDERPGYLKKGVRSKE